MVNPISAQVDCQIASRKGGLLPVAQMLWPTDERSEAETEANARLIASAPDLLAACQSLLVASVTGGLDDSELNRIEASARAAIVRATGAA